MDLLINDGDDTACSVGVWDNALDEVSKRLPWNERRGNSLRLPCRFAVDSQIYWGTHPNRSVNEDYAAYLKVVCKMFGLVKDAEGYLLTPEVNYRQLVFLATLIRQPIELRYENYDSDEIDEDDPPEDLILGEYPMIYARMKQWKVDPMGALCSFTIHPTNDEESRYYGGASYYDNPWGHGLWSVAQKLNKGRTITIKQAQRLCALTTYRYLEKSGHNLGDQWDRGMTPGLLDEPRLFDCEDAVPYELMKVRFEHVEAALKKAEEQKQKVADGVVRRVRKVQPKGAA